MTHCGTHCLPSFDDLAGSRLPIRPVTILCGHCLQGQLPHIVVVAGSFAMVLARRVQLLLLALMFGGRFLLGCFQAVGHGQFKFFLFLLLQFVGITNGLFQQGGFFVIKHLVLLHVLL